MTSQSRTPTHKKAADLSGEALVALTLSSLREEGGGGTGGPVRPHLAPTFVHTSRAAVCTGPYPKSLVRAWHTWDKAHGSENDPVDGPSYSGGGRGARAQLFLVLAMEDAGTDLEKHVVSGGLHEARSILLQVCRERSRCGEAYKLRLCRNDGQPSRTSLPLAFVHTVQWPKLMHSCCHGHSALPPVDTQPFLPATLSPPLHRH
eukprot:366260-Chlamydomonas_euryale.AAC.37